MWVTWADLHGLIQGLTLVLLLLCIAIILIIYVAVDYELHMFMKTDTLMERFNLITLINAVRKKDLI